MEKFRFILLSIFYVISFFLSVFFAMTVTEIVLPLREEHLQLTMFVCAVIFFITSWYLKRQITKFKEDKIEKLCREVAISNEGFVTVFDVVSSTSLGLKDVSAYLEKSCSDGVSEKRYTEENKVEVFYFKGILSLEEKRSAKPISTIKT